MSPRVLSGTWAAALAFLVGNGVRIGSFIDVGSADGIHGLALWHEGLLRQSGILNVDANLAFEPSLKRIREAIGAQYRICALGAAAGTTELHLSAHPYWGSAAPVGHPYWRSVNEQLGERIRVACVRLDDLLAELSMSPPFVLKLDIQGFELEALKGAPATLPKTAAIVCEVFLPMFHELHGFFDRSGFVLFDVTNVNRTENGRFGWCDTVYIHRELAHLASPQIWSAERNDAVRTMQDDRRATVLAQIDLLLAQVVR